MVGPEKAIPPDGREISLHGVPHGRNTTKESISFLLSHTPGEKVSHGRVGSKDTHRKGVDLVLVPSNIPEGACINLRKPYAFHGVLETHKCSMGRKDPHHTEEEVFPVTAAENNTTNVGATHGSI